VIPRELRPCTMNVEEYGVFRLGRRRDPFKDGEVASSSCLAVGCIPVTYCGVSTSAVEDMS
jgi:hypothetical protein